MERYNSCVLCDRSVLRRRKHNLTQQFVQRYRHHAEQLLQEIIPREIPFDGSRCFCHACWVRLDRALHNQPRRNQVIEDQPPQQAEDIDQEMHGADPARNPGVISLQGYCRASNTARRCIFQNCRNVATNGVPSYVKFTLLHRNNFYIPKLARVCSTHSELNKWDELLDQPVIREFNSDHILDIIELYKWGLERNNKLNFENIEEIDDNELHFWTGVTKTQFRSFLQATPSLGNRTGSPATALGIYLTKIRTGEPNERLATIFKMSRRELERMMRYARESMTHDFVPCYLGLDHITRDEVVERNLTIPAHVFGGDNDTAILICDGTYLYVQKSSNFLFQRITYSLHKYLNLLKPFFKVCTDGYILDVVGPYAATTSDATIMRNLMEDDSGWHGFLRTNDVFILDRGFRDSIDVIEEHGYNLQMPPSRTRGQQLTTAEANKSRLITMNRWVVEAINGRFKKDFKIFRHTYFNVSLRNMMADFKITAAIINATRLSYQDSIYAAQFINIINENINTNNELAEYVVENNLNRQRVAFMPLDANDEAFADFPRMTYEELILFTLGTYHLRISRYYCHEHRRPNGLYILEIYRHRQLVDNKVLIRGRIQSRHVRSKQYYTYILINPGVNGREGIEKYYCSCIHGRRTVGSCAHIASIVYFLSWARYEHPDDAPAAFLDRVPIDFDMIE